MKKSKLEFKEKNGKVLKGFSQIDLEELNKKLEKNNTLLQRQHHYPMD